MTTVRQHTDVFRMPALGADMTEGRVVEWYVDEGARADRGDLVAVIETDKSDIEIEVFEPCVFEEFLVRIGELVPVGAPIARVTLDGPPSTTATATPEPQAIAPEPTGAPTVGVRDGGRSGPRRRMTPRARRLAHERGIDPESLPADGTITGDTIVRRSDGSRSTPARTERTPHLRRAIADLMTRSWTEIPHYHVTSTIDLTGLDDRLRRWNESRPVEDRVVAAGVLYLAAARAAHDTPQLNGWWRDGRFEPADAVDLGVVLALRTGGVVVPTIASADRLDTAGMMAAIRELVERARRGRLRGRDTAPASLSVTNMGDLGADRVLGVIHPPQVALLGLGAPRRRPAVVDGDVVPRLLVEASVAGDHRAHDGMVASRFLRHLERHLEELP